MNENRKKVYLGNGRKTNRNLNYAYQSFFVRPASKFWKRYFNKRVRKGSTHKRDNFWYWS